MSFDMPPDDNDRDDPHGECRHEIHRLQGVVTAIRVKLETIVETVGVDKGVVLLNMDSPTRPSLDVESGEPVRCYVHRYFSELGDALIELWEMAKP